MKGIEVERTDIVTMITGMSIMCEALEQEAFGYSAQGVLTMNKDLTEGENAIEYVRSYVDLVGGALRVMSGALNIISHGIVNNEIEITVVE